jgi:predicted glycosyltransferase involved in capsule biosynthesis
MESTTLTVIIPVYNLSGLRLRNFKFVLKNLTKLECDIIVCEQTGDLSVGEYVRECGVTYTTLSVVGANEIHKSALINHSVSLVDSRYVWIVDADFFTQYQEIINYMDKCDYDLICPFESVLFLTDVETDELITTGQLTIGGEYTANNQTGKFSFIVKREVFESVGGMDERFIGWGFQDLDFVENRLPTDIQIGQVEITAYHLFHERPPQTHADNNYKMYSNTRKSMIQATDSEHSIEYMGTNFT